VGVETVRFYERRGLIANPPRGESGYRQFPDETVLRIRFIKKAQELGFTLNEIMEMLALRVDRTAKCEDVRKRAESKIDQIEEKICTLCAMKEALIELTAACRAGKTINECPILENFDMDEKPGN